MTKTIALICRRYEESLESRENLSASACAYFKRACRYEAKRGRAIAAAESLERSTMFLLRKRTGCGIRISTRRFTRYTNFDIARVQRKEPTIVPIKYVDPHLPIDGR
jgi:hypothetical protein